MNKLAVVTAGSRGIGKAIVMRLAQAGFDVATCSRSEEKLQQLQQEVQTAYPSATIYIKPTDMADKAQVDAFTDFVKALERPVELLVNNAGLFVPGKVHEEADGVLEQMINTNLYSAYYATRSLVADMMARKSGYIFNICSTASIIPYINGGSYCISKFALLGFSKVLREEMKEHGVRVTAILPGATLTDSWAGVDLPEERFMPPEDVADALYSAYAMSTRTVVEEILIRPQLGDI